MLTIDLKNDTEWTDWSVPTKTTTGVLHPKPVCTPTKPFQAKSTLYLGRVPKGKHDFFDMKSVRSTKASGCFGEHDHLKCLGRRGRGDLTTGTGTKGRTRVCSMGMMLI